MIGGTKYTEARGEWRGQQEPGRAMGLCRVSRSQAWRWPRAEGRPVGPENF